jgi:hypothetical protein
MESPLKRAKAKKKAAPNQGIGLLKRRIVSLEKEVALLKSAIEINHGTMRVTIEKEKREAIGSNEIIEVGGHSQHRIGRSRTETVGSNRTVTVGTDQVETSARTCRLKWAVIRPSSRDGM